MIINKRISKKELIDNTDLTITSQDNGDWIVDKYGNVMHIVEGYFGTDENGEPKEHKDDLIRELSRYGGNNPKYILDTLGKQFNLIWIDDNSVEFFLRLEPDELTQKEIDDKYREFVVHDMGKIGHKIIDYINSVVEVPERHEDEYLPNFSKNSPTELGKLTTSKDEHYNPNWEDGGLPF